MRIPSLFRITDLSSYMEFDKASCLQLIHAARLRCGRGNCSKRGCLLYYTKRTMNMSDNNQDWGFDIFASATPSPQTEARKPEPTKDESLSVEAIQIVRFVRNTVGGKRREVIDTIVVSYPQMTYERALKIAKHKAGLIGNCMVVEKIERVVGSY